jgi:hypothetical protein
VKARVVGVRFWISFYCLAIGLTALTGCAKSAAPGGEIDGGVIVTDAGEPVTEIDASTGGHFGEECEDSTDCQPGNPCYRPDPAMPGHCTTFCNGDCPDDYECRTVPIGGTVEGQICVPAQETFCDQCQTNADCGDTHDLCIQLTAGRFCSIDCKADPTVCPTGFNCLNLAGIGDGDVWQCMPANGICCVDADHDGRGAGDGCAASDCDDANPAVYDDATEVCDGFDNDCHGGVDVEPHDCAAPACSLGDGSYFERPADVCGGAAGCAQQPRVECGLYTCDGGGELGDACAHACDLENDGKCVNAAHCDASACLADLDNGQVSNEDSDCKSAHSQNGFCCSTGDCCAVSADCPTAGIAAPICEDTATCQGSRGQASCSGNQCLAQNGVPDDTACDATVVASECGFYRAIHCTGAANQMPPSCPTSCGSNADCDANAFCDPVGHTCRGDLDNGQTCPQGNDSCQSAHCQNGFCCSDGDCCAAETDCPASYTTAPTCDVPSACQGTADIAQCVSNKCTTSLNVPNDSACNTSTTANQCGPYQPIRCDGSVTQAPPECPTSCSNSGQCDANAYCNPAGACVPDEPDGQSCQNNGDCQGNHCQNGFCCTSGDCCASASDCGGYRQAPVCDSQTSCQGSRVDAVCTSSFQCAAVGVDDDSACAGLQSDSCGPYPAITCTSATTQMPGQTGLCPTMCTGDGDCDLSAHCANGTCVPDQGTGGFCNTTNECGGALQCVDNVCCSSACNGSCEACDLPGHEGSCTAVPDGQDPDAECGAVGCAGFFAGFSGDQCFRKADVSAAQATCGGNRACHTAAQECSAQAMAGPVTLTCNGQCQDPTGGTCSGTTPGACTNVNPGTQSCGQGACQRTVNQCANGAPATCTPGSPTAETCNNIDDNCDGTLDNSSAFEDSFEPDNSCGQVHTFPQLTSDGTASQSGLTIYPLGDTDFYKAHLHETDGDCGGGGICFNEKYLITVKLTVPVEAGSYRVCRGLNDCSDQDCVTVTAGSTGQLQWFQDGGCGIFGGGQDDYDLYLHVTGQNGQAFECKPYTLEYSFDAGYCR